MADYDFLAHPAQVDVMGAYANALRLNQGINQNRLFQAQQAIGRAQQGAIRDDGTYDPLRAQQLIRDTGDAGALDAGPGLDRAQSLSDAQLKQAFEKTGWVAKSAAGALADPKFDYSDASMMKLLQQGASDGVLTVPEIAKQLQSMPQDPAGRAQWLEQHRAQALSQEQQLQLQYGKPGAVTGPDDRQIGTMTNMRTGAISVPPQQGAPLGASPEFGADMKQITILDPTSPDPMNPRYIPVWVPRKTLPGMPGHAGQPAAGLPGGPGPRGNPTALGPPDAGAAFLRDPGMAGQTEGPPNSRPTPPAPGAPGSGLTLAAPPQGQPERMAADIDAYTKDQAAVPGWNRSVQTLQTAKQALDIARTGPGTANVQHAKAFLKAQGVSLPWMDDERTTNWAIAHKSLLDYARQQGNAGSSDQQLQAALGSNASTDIDKDAAIHVIQQEIGRNNQNIAMFGSHGDKTGAGYGSTRATFANSTDPRAFAADTYSPDELKAMVGKMGKDERAKFFSSLKIAHENGLVHIQ